MCLCFFLCVLCRFCWADAAIVAALVGVFVYSVVSFGFLADAVRSGCCFLSAFFTVFCGCAVFSADSVIVTVS